MFSFHINYFSFLASLVLPLCIFLSFPNEFEMKHLRAGHDASVEQLTFHQLLSTLTKNQEQLVSTFQLSYSPFGCHNWNVMYFLLQLFILLSVNGFKFIYFFVRRALCKTNLDITDVRCQSYGGTVTTSAIKSPVTTRIKSTSEQFFHTYCQGHVLKLAVGYITNKESTLNGTFNTFKEILLDIVN